MKFRTFLHSAAVLVAGLATIATTSSIEAQANWQNATNTNSFWHVPTNWSTGVVPTTDSDDSAFALFVESYEVWWDSVTSNTNAGLLFVVRESVTFQNRGTGYTHTHNGTTIFTDASLVLEGIGLNTGSGSFGSFEIQPNANLTLTNEASVTHDGGTFSVDGQMDINTGCSVNDTSGNLSPIDGGAVVSINGTGAVFETDGITTPNGIFLDIGSTADAGSFNGGNSGTGTVEAFGDLRPGNSPAIVSFGGDLFIGSGATTEIELAGTESVQFDRLNVAGDLTISGNLIVTLMIVEGQ